MSLAETDLVSRDKGYEKRYEIGQAILKALPYKSQVTSPALETSEQRETKVVFLDLS